MVRRLVSAGQSVSQQQENSAAGLRFSSTWQVLGPFQIGTREASWGADPLDYTDIGGFHGLPYDPEAEFRSALPANGTAKWSTVQAKESSSHSTSAKVSLSVGYENVDWHFLKTVYGWAAVQYQAWARGELVVPGDEVHHLVLYTDAVMEYWVDDVHHFGGDLYSFRKAPHVLHLQPGRHKIELRLWRDVRAFGAVNEPTIHIALEVQSASGCLELAKPGILVSDVVGGKLASPLASVSLTNTGERDIELVHITDFDRNETATLQTHSKVIVAGQTRPISFNISLPDHNSPSAQVTVHYKFTDGYGEMSALSVTQSLTHTSIHESHKVTFLHPGGMVSYFMLRPPSVSASCQADSNPLPVLIANHGAGLEADNPMVAHALDSLTDVCAWLVFPTGVTPWSGDDWHNWGFADLEAAVNAIPTWIENLDWTGPGVNVDRWIMTGHSNGGQGTWYALTHRPDKLVAAAPLSGYASIQKYVPYELWQPADPRRTAIISASLNSYRHEMLMENAKGIPVLQQHGEVDDNVPAYHSRFLSQQLYQTSTQSSYHEFSGQSHWWDTVMTTEPLKRFYREQASNKTRIPRPLEAFTIIIADPGDMGPKGGIRILYLDDPGMYGRVDVVEFNITTRNVVSLELDSSVWPYDKVVVDGSRIDVSGGTVTMSKEQLAWRVVSQDTKEDITYRHGRQLGTMTAILRTSGPFVIRQRGRDTARIAVQVSRNLHQYFHADTVVISSEHWNSVLGGRGNVISVCIGTLPVLPRFPIQTALTSIVVRDSRGKHHGYWGGGLGAVFLRPLEGERLELVVWGSDAEGLLQASRLVPTVTGVGQPDFVVLGKSARWRGLEGALALGFFDHAWTVTPASVVS